MNVEEESARMSIMAYVKMLLETNQNINLISRQITEAGLSQLLNETLLLDSYISSSFIVDAGSGNGLLGIPISLLNKNKKIVLIEPKQKKSSFLTRVKNEMNIENLEVHGCSIEEYLKSRLKEKKLLISRGFPDIGVFCLYLKRRMIDEAVVITSENKINNNRANMESLSKTIYNVPLRNDLKILKLRRT